jgi:hypothetical protein
MTGPEARRLGLNRALEEFEALLPGATSTK